MAREVDQHVVEMVFDNDKFERDARTTMSTLDKLKEKLGFSDTSDGFDKLGEAASRVDLRHLEDSVDQVSSRFSNLGIIGMTALQNIASKAVQLGEQIVNALVFDAPKAGFQEYELQQNTIQTIMSATGEELGTVKDQLDQLNEYADQTIYVFSDMTRNISKFTNQGVDLETSVAAIKGISNVAALAGASADQASHAMYNFAQALGAGSVKMIDWKSIQNATMDTVDFKEALIETAGQLGTVTKKIDKAGNRYYAVVKEKTTGSGKNKKTILEETKLTASTFMSTLQSGWLTNDVLLKTLQMFTGDVSREVLESMNFDKDQIDKLLKLGEQAKKAATEIKTATQLFDTLKEAAGTGWAKSFEYIFGNFEEAKDLFTMVGTRLNKWIGEASDARNKFLEGWHNSGGYKAFTTSINRILDSIGKVKEAIGVGFISEGLFSGGKNKNINAAVEATKRIQEMATTFYKAISIREEGGLYDFLFYVSRGAGGAFSILLDFFGSLGSAFGKVLHNLGPFFSYMGKILILVSKFVSSVSAYLKKNKIFTRMFDSIVKILKPVTDLFNKFGEKLHSVFKSIYEWATKNAVVEKVFNVLAASLGFVALVISKLAEAVPKALKKVKDFFHGIWTSVSSWAKPATDWLTEKFKKLSEIGSQVLNGDFSGIEALFTQLKEAFDKGVADAKEWFKKNIADNPIVKGITDFFGGIVTEIVKYFTTDSEGKELVFSKDATWWDKMKEYFENGKGKAIEWFEDNIENNETVKKITKFFTDITEGITKYFTTDNEGKEITFAEDAGWWEKISAYFENGKTKAVSWFDDNIKNNEIVKKIGDFFGPIVQAISSVFAPYEKRIENELGPGLTETTTVVLPWYHRFIDSFQSGISGIERWFKENIADNPIVKAIGTFYDTISEKIGEFFTPTKDENGDELTWWGKIEKFFNDGIAEIEKFFSANPVVVAIREFYKQIEEGIKNLFKKKEKKPLLIGGGPFASDVFGLKGTKEMYDQAFGKEWWEEMIDSFQSGIDSIVNFFRDKILSNPIVEKVIEFFSGIGTAIADTVGSGFAPYEKRIENELGPGLTETTTIMLPWYHRFTDPFEAAFIKIKEWFDENIANNPIIQAVGDFFTSIWQKISSLFASSQDENGNTIPWWTKIITFFVKGRNRIVGFFNDNIAGTPIFKAISGFFEEVVKKVNEFFMPTQDENGGEVTWWEKLKQHFIDGKDSIVTFFNDRVATNPIFQAISGFFSAVWKKANDFFTSTKDADGNTTTWWQKLVSHFINGKNVVVQWFNTQVATNPIIASIAGFFSSIWKSIQENETIRTIGEFFRGIGGAIAETISTGFAPYSKIITAEGDEDKVAFVIVPWYHRFLDIFEDAFEKIKIWFNDKVANNPIVSAIREFFSSTFDGIYNMFHSGEGGTLDLEGGAKAMLGGIADRLRESVEKLKGSDLTKNKTGGKNALETIYDNITNLFVSGDASAEEAAEKAADPKNGGPVTIISLIGDIFHLLGEALVMSWNAISNTLSTMKMDSLWAFLDKLLEYWNAFTFGNLARGFANLTTIGSYNMRAELIENLGLMIGAIALLMGEVTVFAEHGAKDPKVFWAGFGILVAIIGGIIGLMAYANHLSEEGGTDAGGVQAFTEIAESFGDALTNATLLGGIAAVVAALADSLVKIDSIRKSGVNIDDWMTDIGFLAIAIAVLVAMAGLGGLVEMVLGDKLSSALGFDLSMGLNKSGGDSDSSIEKFLNLSSVGIDNVLNVLSIGLSLKAMIDALEKIHDMMRKNHWASVDNAGAEITFLISMITIVISALTLDNIAEAFVKNRSDAWRDNNGLDDQNTEDVKKTIAEALESAANILAIAQAVSMLLDSVEKISRLKSIYGSTKVNEAIHDVEGVLAAVLAVKDIDKFITSIVDSKWSNGSGEIGDASSDKDGSALGALFSQPIIAIAGAVWILAQAVSVLIDASNKLPKGESLEPYIAKVSLLLGEVLTGEGLMKVIDMIPAKFQNNYTHLASLAILAGGVALLIWAIKDIVTTIRQVGENNFDKAVGFVIGAVSGVILALGALEGLSWLGEGLDPKTLGIIAAIMLGLGLIIMGIAGSATGLAAVAGGAAEQAGNAFEQIASGVERIKQAITGMSEDDIRRLNAFAEAVGALANAQTLVSGTSSNFIQAALISWFNLNEGNGENLETLGEHAEGFSTHIPEIVKNLQGVAADLAAFNEFIRFVTSMADLSYVLSFADDGQYLDRFTGNLVNISSNTATAVSNLAAQSNSYEAAATCVYFLREMAELATYFNDFGKNDLTFGLNNLNKFINDLSVFDANYGMIDGIGEIGRKIALGFVGEKDTVTRELATLLSDLVLQLTNANSKFETAGLNFAKGLANGMYNSYNGSMAAVYNAGRNLAIHALTGINDGAGIASPSKEAYARGEYLVAGFVNAMDDDSYLAYDRGMDLASQSLDGMRSALSDELASTLDDDFLTIRPVMDMSDIQNGMDTIDAYTHGYRSFTYGGWKTQQEALQNGSFGSYSTAQANQIGDTGMNVFVPYDDNRVIAGLNNLNARMSSLDRLADSIENMQLVLDSGALVGGIANKMNRRLGIIATREERRS